MSNALAVTDSTFEKEVEKSDGLVVVDFWAAWCGPCRMIGPVLDELAVEYKGKVKVTKVDVDANQKSAIRFNVRSIPLVLFFKDGKVVDTILGAHPKRDYDAKLKQHLAAPVAASTSTKTA
jgi:thioredoxin 1